MGKNICIGLTGSMGNGKSAVAQIFAELGIKVLDADKLAHKVLNEDVLVKSEVLKILPNAYTLDGTADRKAIAKEVFADKNKLELLEKIIHPAIEKIWQSEATKHNLLVVEVPLLYEKRLENKFDLCISVYCSDELRRKRLEQRGMTPQEISERDAFQMSSNQKAQLADIVLFNESSIEFLKMQTIKILSRLTQ